MLPRAARYAMIKKLKVYGGAEHPHTAQQPKVLEL
jgi:large subunit ribosomal protein L13